MAPLTLLRLALLAGCFVSLTHAILPDGRPHANFRPPPAIPRAPIPSAPVVSRNGDELPPYNTTYIFDQLIDHKNPELGTFKQRFWHTWEFYKPGGPIIFMTPGESNAQGYVGYLTNTTINGILAQQENGATIILEHRFFGLSNPKPDLSDESLKLHTIEQAIEDIDYFARNVKLPMPGGDQVQPGKAPWIMIGGSYPGALTAYAMVAKPDLFYAGHSSSGVVETILDYWKYFEPIRNHMPRNCSADIQAVIAHVDEVFGGDNTTAIDELKANFGMSGVKHVKDVAGALRNNLWDWQALQITSGPNTAFRRFCDALEVKDGESAPESGWGLEHALKAWGDYWKNGYLWGICGGWDVDACLTTHDPKSSWWTDTRIDNSWRSWWWIVCNEVGYFQNGAPAGEPTIVSRIFGVEDDLRQCAFAFPQRFPEIPSTVDVEKINAAYGGWDVQIDRIFFANGARDPWLDATMSATGLDIPSTETQQIGLMASGFHCSDLSARSAIDPTVAEVQQQALAAFKKWLSTWEPSEAEEFVAPSITPTIDNRVVPERVIEGKPQNGWFRSFGFF
ncbi:hypothetical protein CCMSSC00406_0009422 [Pleurotus cornucopiae]|uniref:Uncharacterized protein n=1 Tax=Pleurotus cornucopiae TaxID=5321 RepID=A0ACB7IUL7_PLECO|nr:hypothetical protein CCMSSC00406_0009422 [Pleurotus cornucopiae]